MQRRSDGADFDYILHGSDCQAEVHYHLLRHLKAQTLDEGRKSWSLHLEFVISGL